MTIYLVRHAHAGDRHGWRGPDAERPLSPRGRHQAEAVATALARVPLQRVVSSPAARCQQTIAGVAAAHGLTVETDADLSEGTRRPRARAALDALAGGRADVAVCSHGDVIPELLDALAAEGVPLDGDGCAKGSVWELRTRSGRIVAGTYHRAPQSLVVERS